ncbi:hypothetical protein [Curtobacterium sp. MCBA15_001]|uniref:hypothetical protein n=1 Tax=Curtobacterium sp. MCBA15_001 TaxID=1898731 RepID=UPI0008DC8FD6|nr:hypothetical protein [Curtobacterium sp. MCBA15_001]OIH97348.1 hypothetical protein BIU90_15720 [Curtobacterium sp. MCBA15_001]
MARHHPGRTPESLILDRKARTQTIERQIADCIPGQTDVRQSVNGALFTCAGGDRQWVGGADVATEGPADMDSIVELLLQQWDGRDGWVARGRSDPAGLPTAEIVGRDGKGYLVARGTTADEVTIILSSRCFPVPNGFSGAGSW